MPGSCSRVWVHRDNLETPSRAVVRSITSGARRSNGSRRKAGGEDDASFLPSVSLEPSAAALSLLAYNLGNLWRRLGLPRGIENWSLTSLQQRLVKTGGRLVKHARYYWLLLAEGHLNRRRFGAMLGRIALLPIPTDRSAGPAQAAESVCKRLGKKEKCCKVAEYRAISAGRVRISEPLRGGQYEMFHTVGEQRMGV